MKDLLAYLTKSLVKFPDEVEIVETTLSDGTVEFSLRVNPDDMGRIIGKSGKTARAIRLLVSAKASLENKKTRVEIEEEDERTK